MKHDVILSIIFYFCGCFYMVFGAGIIAINTKRNINRLFLLLTISMAIWSFSYSLSNAAPTAESSAFWRSFSVFGWGVFNSLSFHFMLMLTKTKGRLNKRIMLALIYLPAIINIVLFGPYGCLVERQYVMVMTDFGWMNMAPLYTAGIWLNSYYVMFSIATIVLLVQWWKRIKFHSSEKRYAKHFIVSIMLLFLIEAAIDMLPDILGKKFFPKSAVVFLLIPTITLFVLLRKTGQIEADKEIRPVLVPIKDPKTESRLRFFKIATSMFLLGSALSFLIGYFGMHRALEYELMLAACLLLMGIIVRLIPLIKRPAIEDSIFLVIATAGYLHFMVKDADAEAVTVWSIYILFLLFTIILGNGIHAYVFAAISIVIQVIFWIVSPKVPVIIDDNEYITRIFIIVLSFIAVRYLTKEYASKIKGYQRLAGEQGALEKISSSFISVNSKNVQEKIAEMMKTAVEILEFDQAFLVEFRKDCEEATILNMYVTETEGESFSFCPGMTFKTADSLVFKSMLDQKTPLICEDTSNIAFDIAEKHKDCFLFKRRKFFICNTNRS